MRFELLPVVDIMLELYRMPRDMNRFNTYLQTLQGNTKDDIEIPIGGFNPMAKDHAVAKLNELKQIGAEQVISETLNTVNEGRAGEYIKVSLTLADDLMGGWTNRYTTDYQSKFKTGAIVKRNFCTPYFWTSEEYTSELIIDRTRAACYRFIYQKDYPKPETLQEHIEQELFVQENLGTKHALAVELQAFYNDNKETTDLSIIMNFLYGDDAAASLGYTPLGNIPLGLLSANDAI